MRRLDRRNEREGAEEGGSGREGEEKYGLEEG